MAKRFPAYLPKPCKGFLPHPLSALLLPADFDFSLAQPASDDSAVPPQAPVRADVPGAAVPPRAPAPAPERSAPKRGLVPVFDPACVAHALEILGDGQRDTHKQTRRFLNLAERWGGRRRALTRSASLVGLAERFPNFAAVIEYLTPELALQRALRPGRFRLAPILLYGAPGTGKTRFCGSLAEQLGVRFAKVSAGGMQGAFEISGTSRHWSTSAPGRVFLLLAEGEGASPVLLIDEIDKIGTDSQHPVLPALLDLIEEHSARAFRDVALDIEFDASRLIIIATANDLDRVAAPLRSRMQEIEIKAPDVAERRRIAGYMLRELLAGLRPGARLELDTAVLDRLAEAPLDLRALTRALRRALGVAVLRGQGRLRVEDLPADPGQPVRAPMGFI